MSNQCSLVWRLCIYIIFLPHKYWSTVGGYVETTPFISLMCQLMKEFPSRFHSLKCRQIPQMITYYSCTSQERWAFFFFFAVTCISLNFLLFFILASYISVTFFLCFHSLFLSIRFPFAFFQTFFNKVLHMKFHLSLYGNPIRPAERAPYGTLPGSWQDSQING